MIATLLGRVVSISPPFNGNSLVEVKVALDQDLGELYLRQPSFPITEWEVGDPCAVRLSRI